MRRSQPMTCSELSLAMVLLSIAICSAHAESGMAVFYSGGRTASGEVTGPRAHTAAHWHEGAGYRHS